MFREFLNRRPLSSLSLRPEALAFPKAGDPAWSRIPDCEREEILQLDRQFASLPYPMRTASDFLAFSRSGSRKADEDPYFFRRRKLCASLLACCTGTDRLDAVIDGIWCICEETSWVISAHNVNPVPGAPSAGDFPLPDPEHPVIDLFAAQTGMILAFVSSLLEKQLDAAAPLLRQRISREIRGRILEPFLSRDDFWWMGITRKDLNNWTPWIIANVLYCACLQPLPADGFLRLAEKALCILDRYLDVIPPDGGCDEGPGYWNMAGGSLADCLETLEIISGGALFFWQEEKIRNLMAFPLNTAVGNGWFANFADCDARPFLSGERIQLAGEKTGNPALAALGKKMRGTLADQLMDTPHLNRVLQLLFHPEEPCSAAPSVQDTWLPDLQWRIVRRGGWTLCCKGGHNGENHNHNDVGSFMLYVDGEPVLVDAGNMTYTAATFSDRRYTLWNVRSAYHNVPMIGGTEQAAGAAFSASETEVLPDGLSLDLRNAYPESCGLLRCHRAFRLSGSCLSVKEEVVLRKDTPVTWVWMLRYPPRILDQTVLIGPVGFSFPEGFRADAEEIPVQDPRMARNYPGSLWRLSVTSPASCRHECEWILLPAEHFSKGEDSFVR